MALRGDSLFRSMLGTQAKLESKPEPAAEPKPVAPAPEVPAPVTLEKIRASLAFSMLL